MFESIRTGTLLAVWVLLMFASVWIQLDGIELLVTDDKIAMIAIFAVSAMFFPPASFVWFIAGIVSYF